MVDLWILYFYLFIYEPIEHPPVTISIQLFVYFYSAYSLPFLHIRGQSLSIVVFVFFLYTSPLNNPHLWSVCFIFYLYLLSKFPKLFTFCPIDFWIFFYFCFLYVKIQWTIPRYSQNTCFLSICFHFCAVGCRLSMYLYSCSGLLR